MTPLTPPTADGKQPRRRGANPHHTTAFWVAWLLITTAAISGHQFLP